MPDEEAPQLYQVIGAALRDVAQARFMSDLFSRQISYAYEKDPLLRRFPVPRVDVDEVEITLQFAITQVAVDPGRHAGRNGAIGSLFSQYSTAIVRDTLTLLRDYLPAAGTPQREALADIESRIFSDASLERFSGRILQYFEDFTDDILDKDGKLKVDTILEALDKNALSVLSQPELATVERQFGAQWPEITAKVKVKFREEIEELAARIDALDDKYPDFKLVVAVDAVALQNTPRPLSSVRIRSHVKNYTWTKVDMDDSSLHQIRTLTPE